MAIGTTGTSATKLMIRPTCRLSDVLARSGRMADADIKEMTTFLAIKARRHPHLGAGAPSHRGAHLYHPRMDYRKPQDFLLSLAWPFLLVGAATTPMLVFRIAGFTIGDICFAIGGLLVLLSMARPKVESRPLVQIAVALGAIGVLSASISSYYASESILVGVRVLYVWTIWQFTVRSSVTRESHLVSLIRAFVIGASLSALAAIAQVTVGLSIPGSEIVFGRVPGLNTHVNGQGGVLAVAAALAFALVVNGVGRRVNSIAVILAFVGLILAGSVTGMLGAVIGILAVLITRGVTMRTVVFFTASVAAIWVLASNIQSLIPGVSSPLDRLRDTTGNGQDVGTLALRLYTDEFAWRGILNSPIFGVGLDPVAGGTYDGVTLTHNMLLLTWYQGGIFLFVAFLLVLIATARLLFQTHNRKSIAGSALMGGVAAAFACAMTAPVLFDRFFWISFVLALALPNKPGGLEPYVPTVRTLKTDHVMRARREPARSTLPVA